MNALLDLMPWWGWGGVGAAGVFLAWRYLGTSAALAAGGALLLFLARQNGRESAKTEDRMRDMADTVSVVKEKKEVTDAANGMAEPDLDRANAPWVRRR